MPCGTPAPDIWWPRVFPSNRSGIISGIVALMQLAFTRRWISRGSARLATLPLEVSHEPARNRRSVCRLQAVHGNAFCHRSAHLEVLLPSDGAGHAGGDRAIWGP